MSTFKEIQIACPACGKEYLYRAWGSVNTAVNPELKSAVRDGSLFLFKCPSCGHETIVNGDFLYHQMEDHIWIQYASSNENAAYVYNLLKKDEDLSEDYLIRIVRSQNELREKLAILDAGLDDRIVELIKAYMYLQVRKENPKSGSIETLYFNYQGRDLVQVFVDGQPTGVMKLPSDLYDQLERDFSKRLPDIRKDGPIIDRRWAFSVLGIS